MHQYSQGQNHTQGHKGIPAGQYEEEQGRAGFFGPVSHLLKATQPTRWTSIEGPLKPHLFDAVKVQPADGKWQRLLFNQEVVIYKMIHSASSSAPTQALRNADGETLYFVHQGTGVVLTEYGLLEFKKGTYISIPKCVTHSIYFTEKSELLIIESRQSSYREPERGMVGRNAFYDLASLGKPDLEKQNEWLKNHAASVVMVNVKREDVMTRFNYSENIYDTVAWKGDFFPFTLHINDMMPMMSHRVHLPPSAHTTFVAQGFVVCTFLPRLIETDDDALKVPFYHQNIDYDEVLFYHDGNFFSRDNLHSGMITLHPAGFPHGPHPKAFANQGKKTFTDEVAVMIDTRNHLQIDDSLTTVEVTDYWNSWNKK